MQRRIAIFASVFLVPILLTVSLSGQIKSQQPSPNRPVEGASIFRNYCVACHGIDGRGNRRMSEAFNREIPDLTGLALRNNGAFPSIHVRTVIMFGGDDLLPAHGRKPMPMWGPIFHEIEFDQDLGNVRLDNVTAYIESMQRK